VRRHRSRAVTAVEQSSRDDEWGLEGAQLRELPDGRTLGEVPPQPASQDEREVA